MQFEMDKRFVLFDFDLKNLLVFSDLQIGFVLVDLSCSCWFQMQDFCRCLCSICSDFREYE